MTRTAPNSRFHGVATGLMALAMAAGAQAATTTIAVDSTAQEVPFVTNANCTLGEAIRAANTDAAIDNCTSANFGTGGPFVIELAATTYTLTQPENMSVGPTGLPEITSAITIDGNGAIIERSSAMGMPKFRIFTILAPAGTLVLKDVTLRNGLALGDNGVNPGGGGSAGLGGAIFNQGTLTLERVTLQGNTAFGGQGGGASGGIPEADVLPPGFGEGGAPGMAGGFGGGGGGGGFPGGFGGGFGGSSSGGGGFGGGGALFNDSGSATLINCTVSGNLAQGGGSGGVGETGAGYGGGLFNLNGTLTLRNSTIANNSAVEGLGGTGNLAHAKGGALYNLGDHSAAAGSDGTETATVTVVNSILADTPSAKTDCENVTTAGGVVAMDGSASLIERRGTCSFSSGSFLELDPQLAALSLNAPGITPTQALMPGSPALSAGHTGIADGISPDCEPTDQRGVPRPQPSGACDIGAYELGLDGDPCGTDSECGAGHCVDGVCCNTACGCGTCNIGISLGFCTDPYPADSPGDPSCAPYVCDGTSTECPSRLGESCTVADTCGSGFCVDSVCCESACSQDGFACNLPGSEGLCRAPQGVPVLSASALALLVLALSALAALAMRRRRRA